MRDRVTFCIKTIHRPHCCATLVRSIYEHCGDDRPLIYVLDDGKPDLRFSQVCPDEASLVDRLIESEYDIGLSAGRNGLIDLGQRDSRYLAANRCSTLRSWNTFKSLDNTGTTAT